MNFYFSIISTFLQCLFLGLCPLLTSDMLVTPRLPLDFFFLRCSLRLPPHFLFSVWSTHCVRFELTDRNPAEGADEEGYAPCQRSQDKNEGNHQLLSPNSVFFSCCPAKSASVPTQRPHRLEKINQHQIANTNRYQSPYFLFYYCWKWPKNTRC